MLKPNPEKAKMKVNKVAAIIKSKRFEKVAARGKTSRGKYILVMRFMLLVKLLVANLIEPTKKAHGTDFTDTEATEAKSMGLPENIEKAVFTRIPAETTNTGINMAHIKPMIDCLYFIFISRHVSIKSRWRYVIIS